MTTRTTTKTERLRTLLSRPEGAGLTEICAVTGWQPHSARAAISGLRKAGAEIMLEKAPDDAGTRRYHLAPSAASVALSDATAGETSGSKPRPKRSADAGSGAGREGSPAAPGRGSGRRIAGSQPDAAPPNVAIVTPSKPAAVDDTGA